MEVDYSAPDSTVGSVGVEDIEEDGAQSSLPTQTALQLMNWHLIENQNLCANLLAASIRERDRVRAELRNAHQKREAIAADLLHVHKMRESATRSCMNAKASLREAAAKRLSLLKEIETEKMWRPPSVIMSQKKQRELRERVEYMRALLRVKIRTPDEVQ